MMWENHPEKVRDLYAKREIPTWIQSTAGHVKPGGKMGGPPSKPKYYLVTDREEYCEGTVKRTPGGE